MVTVGFRPVGETILVVDDEATILNVTRMTLERAGYDVLAAKDPEETLLLCEKSPPLQIDLVVMDFVLPAMNGVTLAERIRRRRPNLPVLYCSAYPQNESLRPAIARGVPYLAKPFTREQLTTAVRAILDAER